MARILFIAGFGRSLTVFRGDLMRDLLASGHEVSACCPPTDAGTVAELEAMGVPLLTYSLHRTGTNPAADFQTYRDLRRVMREVAPDHVFCYTIKPVIYGCLAARRESVPHIHAMITGLGTAFEKQGVSGALLNHMASLLYRRALTAAETVIFQNPDDRAEFTGRGLVTAGKVHLVNGSGVDIDHFAPSPIPDGPPMFLLIARLLRDKGVREFASAARILHEQGHDCCCRIIGFFDDHPQGIRPAEVEQWTAAGWIEFGGEKRDVRPDLAACTVYCLPSYREGLPRTVLEAMSTGRAIITTDAPGCRETVTPDDNGFLVAPRDAESLAQAMASYIVAPELAHRHGARSREIVVERFAVTKVNRAIREAIGLAADQPR